MIERAHDYLESSFLPGRRLRLHRRLQRPAQRVAGRSKDRSRRALGCSPAQRIGADKAALLALPPLRPVTGWRALGQAGA